MIHRNDLKIYVCCCILIGSVGHKTYFNTQLGEGTNISKTFIKIEKVNKHNEVVPRCVNFKMPCPDWGISGYFDKLVT